MRIKEILTTLYSIVKSNDTSPLYICGGIPRDKLIGSAKSKFDDLDVTTGDVSIRRVADQFAIKAAEQYGGQKKVAEDGHVSVKLGEFKVDFSSNFIVPGIDKMIPGPLTDLQKEMFSRDFTCNALLLSLDLKTISDPTGAGLRDIKNKIIKTCLPPDATFKNNVNRIPRVIYVSAKLGFDIDPEIIKWIRENPQYTKQVKPRYMLEKIERAMQFDQVRTLQLIELLDFWKLLPDSSVLAPFRKKV